MRNILQATRKHHLGSTIVVLAIAVILGCSKGEDKWTTSPGVTVTVFKQQGDDGKDYLTVLYENFGQDTIEQLKYQLISQTGPKIDTEWRTIVPPKLFMPKDRHALPRHIGEAPVTAEYLHVGKVLVMKAN